MTGPLTLCPVCKHDGLKSMPLLDDSYAYYCQNCGYNFYPTPKEK